MNERLTGQLAELDSERLMVAADSFVASPRDCRYPHVVIEKPALSLGHAECWATNFSKSEALVG